MAQFYIVNLEDGVATKTDDAAVAGHYEEDDSYVVIDTGRDIVNYDGDSVPIEDDSHDPDEPGEEEQDD